MNVARFLARQIPSSLLRWCGRQQFERPGLAPLIRWGGRLIRSGVATIQYGPGKGLMIDASLGFPGYALGTTEPGEQSALQSLLQTGDTFWNVGANIGFHAILGARVVGPSGRVVAFEPAPNIAPAVVKNAALNHFKHIDVVQKAVSDTTGKVKLFLGEASAINTILGDQSKGEECVEVDAITLNEYFEESGHPPNVISIDVEGAEIHVLAGGMDIIRKFKPRVLLELHWIQREFYEFYDRNLTNLGYKLLNLDSTPYERKFDPIREHIIISPS